MPNFFQEMDPWAGVELGKLHWNAWTLHAHGVKMWWNCRYRFRWSKIIVFLPVNDTNNANARKKWSGNKWKPFYPFYSYKRHFIGSKLFDFKSICITIRRHITWARYSLHVFMCFHINFFVFSCFCIIFTTKVSNTKWCKNAKTWKPIQKSM